MENWAIHYLSVLKRKETDIMIFDWGGQGQRVGKLELSVGCLNTVGYLLERWKTANCRKVGFLNEGLLFL